MRSFADSDRDGIGDPPELIDRLDYLDDGGASTTSDPGVTGIWLMPVAKSARRTSTLRRSRPTAGLMATSRSVGYSPERPS